MEKNISEEDYLKKHIDTIESSEKTNNVQVFDTVTSSSRTTDLQFLSLDINELPCGEFYPVGTSLMVRAAQVREIQSYSMVDDNNFYDMVEKMNDMLQSCVRVKYSDGRMGTYLDIKDQDRIYLIFLIVIHASSIISRFSVSIALSLTSGCPPGIVQVLSFLTINN